MRKKDWEAVIFDMDGVLVNSEPHHQVIERGMFDEMKIPVSEEEHREFMGMASDEMWAALIGRYHLTHTKGELMDKNNAHIIRYFSDLKDSYVIPGVKNFLEALEQHQMPVAVASSSSASVVDHLLEGAGLSRFFEIRVSGQMVEKSKPEPFIYFYTAELLEVDPEACLVIEDSTNGILSAKAAGMYCVAYQGVGYGGQDQSMADLIIRDFDELLELFSR